MPLPPIAPLFPYTTLFRSVEPDLFVVHGLDLYVRRRTYRSRDRKSTRLNSCHVASSYAVFCLKKKSLRRARSGGCSRELSTSPSSRAAHLTMSSHTVSTCS